MPSSRSKSDKEWILRTIELARRGFAGASPNPYVGCVIVKDGKAVGEGAHLYFGGPHAEVHALKEAGHKAKGATVYTNLEPCSHWGKTPPCALALIRAGVKKVVSAMRDPNPLVAGKGFAALKKAGIKVITGVVESEARHLNRSFIKFIRERKPYVFLKSALSLDGKSAAGNGDSKWISSEESRNFARRLRAEVDGILVGGQTVRQDNPSLTAHGFGRNPVRIVLSKSGKLPKKSKVFDGKAQTWVLKGSIKEVMSVLGRQGISRLLVEGGDQTASEFLKAGEVDEVLYFVAPILLGGAQKMNDALRLEGVETWKQGQDIAVWARVKK